MGIEDAKNGKLIYHLTSLSNLESIIKNGLMSRKKAFERGIKFDDVADREIISERKKLELDNYIPFHFHPYSAFDVAVKHKYDADKMIYLCVTREFANKNGFMILPQHPLSGNEKKLYDYSEGFGIIDWVTLQQKNRNDDYAKEVKMAECLTDRIIPINEVYIIYVPSKEVENCVNRIFDCSNVLKKPLIYSQPVWFENYS